MIFQGTFGADMNGNDAVAQERNHCSLHPDKLLQLKFSVWFLVRKDGKSYQSLNTSDLL